MLNVVFDCKCCSTFYITPLQEHEKQVQLLVEQLADSNTPQQELEVALSLEEDRERIQLLESKVKLLEKDLFYYKKTSRELKKKLQSHSRVVKGEGDGGGKETKSRVASSSGGAQGDHFQVEDLLVVDSLQLPNEKILAVSGTSLAAGTHSRGHAVEVISSSDDKVSHPDQGQAPPTGEELQVIRKQKKQLRQLR